ncbi:MAG: substrate-binding domain-containing protein [Clostridiales bacterium]|jgi:methyl-accepting chemotaxis protein/ribose transport system substrate-binding protein|nr:substrate-binding domain-containing protein [Clostridiales bacterium]
MSERSAGKSKERNYARIFIFSTMIAILVLLAALIVLNLSVSTVADSVFNVLFIVLFALAAFLLISLINFFRAIHHIDENAEHLSQGKLNISDIMVDKTRGLESLTVAVNDLKRNLLNFIESTKINVIVLSDAVDNITKSLDMSYKGNEHIASNMAAVAEKAQQQLKIVKETLDGIEEVANRANNITTTLAKIEEFVENTVKVTEEGSEHVDKYNEQMDVISTNLSDTAAFIEALNTHLKEIDQVNGLIINITEQLKLLSLNSAVEAARAGEAGRGFVVVAQEMNKLSSATRDSIGQINRLLNNILNSNAKVSESISSCVESFDISKDIFNSVKDTFYTINKNTYILSDDMKKVYEESRLINENTKGISVQGQTLHDASNEISSITQDVAAVTEEELAENEEINNQALSLQNMLSGIENLLMRYRTSVVPVEQTSTKRLKIALFSPLDHPFWEGVRQGALYAQTELKAKNVDVDYLGYTKDFSKLNIDLKERIENNYDGLILPGFLGGIDEDINIAMRKSIAVMSFNCDYNEGVDRISYFGPDIPAQGRLAGEVISKALDNEGEIAIIRGPLETSINRVRRDAIYDVIIKKKKMKIAAEIEAEADNTRVYKNTKEALNKFPNLRGIVILTGGIIGAARAVEEMNLVGKVQIVCFDYDDDVLKLIKKGVIYAAIGQDPFGQGHDPIISMYNYLVTGERPDTITYTRTELLDKRSVAD